MTFYQYMMHYPHKFPARLALAAELGRLAKVPQLKDQITKISSLSDLMSASLLIEDSLLAVEASGSLWCEYCAAVGRPAISEEEIV